jgi:hypothetical protein
MKIRSSILALVIANNLIICCNLSQKCGANNNFSIAGGSLHLTPNVMVKKRTPVPDFDIFTFYLIDTLSKPKLNLYLGNQPSFNKLQQKVKKIKIGNLNAKEVFTKNTNTQEYSREVLIFNKGNQWPQYYHFWYVKNTFVNSQIVDSIINSFCSIPQ